MERRLELHEELSKFVPNVYFQPPSNIRMMYPCIVYAKTSKNRRFGNDEIYNDKQGYQLTLIEKTPESNIADSMEKYFQYCTITQYYTFDNLAHITLQLFY